MGQAEKPKRQQLVWLAPSTRSRSFSIEKGERPNRIWTLYAATLEGDKPSLPLKPVHLHDAFAEDYVNDWSWCSSGVIRYYSRVVPYEQGVWLLLEWA